MSNHKNIILLSKLPFNCDENQIINFIFSYGKFTIDNINLRTPKGKNPFAYIKFKYPNESYKAIKLLNNQNFNGSNIIVKQFIPIDERINPNNLFVGNLPYDMTQEELFEIFSKFGKISMLIIKTFPNSDNANYAQINFENEQDANNAINSLDKFYIRGKNLNVKYFLSKDKVNNDNNENDDNNVPMLIINDLPNSLDNEELLKSIFEIYGKIQKHGILKENNKKIGVIIYSQIEEAENAKNGMSSQKLKINLIPFDQNIINKIENSNIENNNYNNNFNYRYGYKNKDNRMSSSTSITTSTNQSFILVKNECNTLMIKNLTKDINEIDLKNYFSQFGDIKKIKIETHAKLSNVYNEKGEIVNKKFIFESLGKAIITYKTISSAKLAKNTTNDKEILIKNHLIKCEIDYVEKKVDAKKYRNINLTQISQPISFSYSNNNLKQIQNGNYNKYEIGDNYYNNHSNHFTNPNKKITVECENLFETVKNKLQIENPEERTEALGETLYYFLIKFIPQYKLNITRGKCEDDVICARLTGILIKSNQEYLLQIISKTTRLYNALKEVLLNLMQNNQLIE